MDARFPVTTARLIIAFAFAIAGAAVQTACTYPGSPALDALRTRAEAGNVESQYRLGLRHSSGRDVEQDYETANAWFARAALAGYDAILEALQDPPETPDHALRLRRRLESLSLEVTNLEMSLRLAAIFAKGQE